MVPAPPRFRTWPANPDTTSRRLTGRARTAHLFPRRPISCAWNQTDFNARVVANRSRVDAGRALIDTSRVAGASGTMAGSILVTSSTPAVQLGDCQCIVVRQGALRRNRTFVTADEGRNHDTSHSAQVGE